MVMHSECGRCGYEEWGFRAGRGPCPRCDEDYLLLVQRIDQPTERQIALAAMGPQTTTRDLDRARLTMADLRYWEEHGLPRA